MRKQNLTLLITTDIDGFMDVQELKEWRARHKLTQAQLAAQLGLSVDTYRGWEQGKSWPSGDLLPLALEALERRLPAKV